MGIQSEESGHAGYRSTYSYSYSYHWPTDYIKKAPQTRGVKEWNIVARVERKELGGQE